MPALEPLPGIRVVATPDALDGARWAGADVSILRLAPDEVLAIGATSVDLDDPDAIVEVEAGFVGVWLGSVAARNAEVADVVSGDAALDAIRAHVDWNLTADAGVLEQGKAAGVPARIITDRGGRVLVVTHAAYAHELTERLGWSS